MRGDGTRGGVNASPITVTYAFRCNMSLGKPRLDCLQRQLASVVLARTEELAGGGGCVCDGVVLEGGYI